MVIFNVNKRDINQSINLHLNNNRLNEMPNAKYLGLTIQNNLKWDEHIKTTIKKINRLIPIFYEIKKSPRV